MMRSALLVKLEKNSRQLQSEEAACEGLFFFFFFVREVRKILNKTGKNKNKSVKILQAAAEADLSLNS